MKQYRVALVLAAMSTVPVVSHAGPSAALEDVLVTGSYAPQAALTASVSVIDARQIETLNKRTLAGLLQTLPGVLVEEQGGPGGLTAVSIRGGESNFTLVLLDGVPLNDPTNSRGGGFDFANLGSALVERIEVVRGAQSAIYGSDALAGVINIITRRAREGHSQQVHAEAGEDDYYTVRASALGREGDIDYTLEVASRDDGEPVPGSSRDTDAVNLRLGWQPLGKHGLLLAYRYLDGNRRTYPEQGGGPQYALSGELDHSDYQDQVLSLAWKWQVTDGWRSTVSSSRFRHEEDYSSPGIAPFFEVPPNAADTDFTRDQLQWLNTLKVAEGYELSVGADYRREEGESDGYLAFAGDGTATDFDLDRNTAGVFADLTATPSAALLLHGSVRYDEPDDFDSETSWQAGARVELAKGLSVAANWGEAYKLPSFFALGHPLVGNPGLLPEQAESLDLGISWQAVADLRLELTWFANDFKDLVDFDDDTFRNVNRRNIETSGLELQLSWQALPTLVLRAQGTYTDLDVKNEDTVLTGRPEWTAGLVTEWQFAQRWQTTLDYRYTGGQWAASRHTGGQVTGELDDFHRVDWVLQWRPLPAWQLQLAMDNLLDEDYETAVGFIAPDRALRLGVRFSH